MDKKELSNMDIALFALYKLGGISKKIHTEEIAWEAFRLAKERFSWRLSKFRQMGFPDKTPVRFALEEAKRKERGELVVGKSGGDISGDIEGWQLAPQGVIWIKENEERIIKSLKLRGPDLPKREAERFIKRIRSDAFFKYFQEKKNLNEAPQYMFTDMLLCAPDAANYIIKQKFNQLYSNAKLLKNQEILDFLEACKSKFGHLMI